MKTKEIIKKEYELDNAFCTTKKACARSLDKRRIPIIGILIFTMLLSIFVAPFVVDKLHIIDKAEETLDSKKDVVVAVTATAATISVAVAAIPGDSTTPLANQIAELDIFFIIVLISIYLLKILLVISTSLSFKFLFPLACLLFATFFFSNINCLKKLAIKMLIFGLVVFLTVPISVGTMNVVDTALRTQEKVETVSIEDNAGNAIEKENGDESFGDSFWNDIADKVKEATDNAVNATKEVYQKAKDKFSELIDIVASLIITCCAIPLLVIVFLAWILKILFGINISTKNIYSNLHSNISKTFIKRTKSLDDEDSEN